MQYIMENKLWTSRLAKRMRDARDINNHDVEKRTAFCVASSSKESPIRSGPVQVRSNSDSGQVTL